MFINLLNSVSNNQLSCSFNFQTGKEKEVRKGTPVHSSLSQPPNFSAACICFSVAFFDISFVFVDFIFVCLFVYLCVCVCVFAFSTDNLTKALITILQKKNLGFNLIF